MKEIKVLYKVSFTETLEKMEVDSFFNLQNSVVRLECARNTCSAYGRKTGRKYQVVTLDNENYRVLRLS